MVTKKFGKGNNFIDLTFSQKIVYLAKLIPEGKVSTYGELARLAGGSGRAAQSITSILGRAELSGEKAIPFHRVVYSDGRVWLGEQHRKERLKQYEKERIKLDSQQRIIDFHEKRFDFHTLKIKNRRQS